MKPVFGSVDEVLAQVGKTLGESEWMAITQERISPKPGAPITLVPTVDRIHLFDQQSGKRLEVGA